MRVHHNGDGVMRIINPITGFGGSSVNRGSRDFELSSSQYLTGSVVPAVNPGDSDCWGACWCKFESVPSVIGSNRGLMALWTIGGDTSYALNAADVGSGANFRLVIRNASDSANTAFNHSEILSADQWYFFMWYHNAVGNQVGLSVDGGAFETTSYSGGIKAAVITPFKLGWANSGGIDQYMDGLICNAAFGQPPSTPTWSDIRDALYNSGNALFWESISISDRSAWGLTPGNGVWYPLNEINAGDDAVDNVASLVLSDVNTVGVSADVP